MKNTNPRKWWIIIKGLLTLLVLFKPKTIYLLLLIIWEFYIMYINHTHFPFLPGIISHTCRCQLPPKNKKREKKGYPTSKHTSKGTQVQFVFMYTHSSMLIFPVASPSKKTDSSPTPFHSITTRSHQVWRVTWQCLYHYL